MQFKTNFFVHKLQLIFVSFLFLSNISLAKQEFVFKVKFFVPFEESEWTTDSLNKWIDKQLSIAENLYSESPALKFEYSIERIAKEKEGLGFQVFTFKNELNYHKKMNRYFDIPKGDSAYFPVLLVQSLRKNFGKKSEIEICGKANTCNFILCSKHGMVIERSCTNGTFAHELGHVLHLKHIFSFKFFQNSCSKKYKFGKKGRGSSFIKKTKSCNVMDYKRYRADYFYLDKCQSKKAAKFRKRLMDKNGNVKFKKLKYKFYL